MLKAFSSNVNIITQEMVDDMIDFITINQKMIFVKCWMESEETDCDFLVLNTLLNTNNFITPSYSVNLVSKVAEIFQGNHSLGKAPF